ncbi:hypothetical protein ACQKWADRAFT_304576 [Trichoderma austrokoningii]
MSPGSACQRCRKRHIKCDGTRPSCKQCVSAKHECPGYNEDWKFINNGAKLPHRRQKRQSSRSTKIQPPHEFADTTEKTSAIQEDSIIESRHGSTSFPTQRTESLGISSLDFPKAAETTLQNLDSSISLPVDFHFELGDNNVHETVVGNIPAHFQNSGPAPEASPGLLSSGSSSEFGMGLAALASEFMLESEQEIIFLLRHYVDNLAPWLDIFNEKCFFKTRIPRLVGTNPALKYAIAALSAKHLSHVGGFRATNCGLRSMLALTEMYPSAGHVDWAFKAANYYHQAATSSQQQSQLYDTIGHTSPEILDVATSSSAILTIYELIDSNHDEFHTRIHNVKSKLAQYSNDTSATKSYFPPFKQPANPFALASYWLCMPHDLLNSYDQKRIPILNFETSYGNVEHNDDTSGVGESTFVFRTPWVRLFSLITNIISQFTTTPSVGDHMMKNPESNSWFYLWGALDNWHSQLDASFEPYSHYTLSSHLTLPQAPQEPIFDEILFPTGVSAATLSYYHFARVLLLLAKPIDQSNPLTLLKDYRERLVDIRDNCIKICGIAAGRPDGAARIHSVQPLILAGQCLEDTRERKAVIQLLQGVESDTGWPTAAQVGRLQEEWYGKFAQS